VTPLVRRYIKTGILFLLFGICLGGWMLAQRELRGLALSPYIVSAHTHLLLVGFVMMMILGVALWMFPRPRADDTTYRPIVAEVAYWLITIGTAARAIAECIRAGGGTALWLRAVVVASGLAQILGLVAFFATMWSRIRASGARSVG
jgi:heme/copper-type cytochrome/quinol oxidase subunit 1